MIMTMITKDNMITYKNGNVTVEIDKNGTKTRQWEGEQQIEFPESIDVKITDYCDMGCAFCHESSTIAGKHGNLYELHRILSELPSGIELAIGGGNPLSHPQLWSFLQYQYYAGRICNITINQGHISSVDDRPFTLIRHGLVQGVGVSVTNVHRMENVDLLYDYTSNIVLHVIAGIHNVDIIPELIKRYSNPKILVLGFKKFGFGANYKSEYIDRNINDWRMYLPQYLGKTTMCFDNLAIEQLHIKKWIHPNHWDSVYMGDDFTTSMYIDAVKQEYAPTSRSPLSERVGWDDKTLLQFFKQGKL